MHGWFGCAELNFLYIFIQTSEMRVFKGLTLSVFISEVFFAPRSHDVHGRACSRGLNGAVLDLQDVRKCMIDSTKIPYSDDDGLIMSLFLCLPHTLRPVSLTLPISFQSIHSSLLSFTLFLCRCAAW